MLRSINWRHFDFWLFGVTLLLTVFGVAMIQSAIAGNESLAGHVNRQIIFAGAGLVIAIITTIVDYHYWSAIIKPLYAVTIVALIIVYVAGQASFGAARWLSAGLVNIQPSELGKIVIILALADYFGRTKDQPKDLKWIVLSLAITGFMVIWIILQPNLSISIVLMVLWFTMLWVSGLPVKYLLIFSVVGLILGVVSFPFLEQYQQMRVINFLYPDPNATHGNTYNVDQALISIGSGGWFGMGYGHGTQVQLKFLKVRHTDFIFSAMAEEFGFVGTAIVIGLLVFVIIRCLRVAYLAKDTFGGLIAFGFAILIFFQTIVNIGVNLQVIPVTGLTLPFISYGGSSILSLLLGIGLVESVILRHKPLEF
jgi:rod shape determining protein RodA